MAIVDFGLVILHALIKRVPATTNYTFTCNILVYITFISIQINICRIPRNAAQAKAGLSGTGFWPIGRGPTVRKKRPHHAFSPKTQQIKNMKQILCLEVFRH